MKKIKFLSLFSGIGAPEQSLKDIGVDFELIGFSEIDKYAIKSYCSIHDVDENLNLGDITKVDIKKLPLDIDLITHGSPCQDFSVAGKGNGGDKGTGTRSSLMWNTVEIVKHCNPKYIIWENVKNVLSEKHKHNYYKYLEILEDLGYKNYSKVINAKSFVPQNRERIFVVSIRNDIEKYFKFPVDKDSRLRLKDILETNVDESFYLSDDKTKNLIEEYVGNLPKTPCIGASRGRNPNNRSDRTVGSPTKQFLEVNSRGISNTLTSVSKDNLVIEEDNQLKFICGIGDKDIVGDNKSLSRNYPQGNRVYSSEGIACSQTSNGGGLGGKTGLYLIQSENEINKIGMLDMKGNEQIRRVYDPSGISPALDTMQGGHRQPKVIVEGKIVNYRIRKLTPRESFRLMGFADEQFDKAQKVNSKSQLYKQAGNSIVVPVLSEIFKELLL